MAIETISYSTKAQGWNSFHSWIPDTMIGLNSSLYSWKNGELYKHHTNPVMNNFYGVDYPSKLTTVFNEDATEQKIFKTVGLEGTDVWQADITTDLSTGIIETDYYKEKEGSFYAYIRRTDGTISTEALSTQGVGSLSAFADPVLTFGFKFVEAPVATGDKLYILNGNTLDLIETVTAHAGSTITVVTPQINVPTSGDFIVLVKDSTAESFHQRGYYMEVALTNNSTSPVDLFSISTEVARSYI